MLSHVSTIILKCQFLMFEMKFLNHYAIRHPNKVEIILWTTLISYNRVLSALIYKMQSF